MSRILDIPGFPLRQARLIEASAGTGKTYTITGLYLRLLLGRDGPEDFGLPLTVDKILVVTFTEAATAELRGRILARIRAARKAFDSGEAVITSYSIHYTKLYERSWLAASVPSLRLLSILSGSQALASSSRI